MTQKRFSGMRKRGGGGGEKERSMGLREREKENKCLPVNYQKKRRIYDSVSEGENEHVQKKKKVAGKKE